MSGVNKVILIGRLGKDPEATQVSSGQTVCKMSLATSEKWNDRDGNKKERTEWHNIVVWGQMASVCSKHLSKGSQVYIEGRLQNRSWEDKDGQKKYITETVATSVQFLSGNMGEKKNSNNQPQQNFGPAPSFDPGEELPF